MRSGLGRVGFLRSPQQVDRAARSRRRATSSASRLGVVARGVRRRAHAEGTASRALVELWGTASVRPRLGRVPQYGEGGGGGSPRRPPGTGSPSTQQPDLVPPASLLGHLVGEVAEQPVGPVVEDGGHEGVLRGEVPVEGLVGQPGLGHDVGHAGPCVGAAPRMTSVRRRSGGAPRRCSPAPARSASAGDPRGDVTSDLSSGRDGFSMSQNVILPADERGDGHGVGVRDRSRVPGEARLGRGVRGTEVEPHRHAVAGARVHATGRHACAPSSTR